MSGSPVRLGLRENAAQFSLLVAVNAFVGAMVGLERSTLPLVGREEFGLASSAATQASSSANWSARLWRRSKPTVEIGLADSPRPQTDPE